MKFRSVDCRRVDIPLDWSRWTVVIEAGEGAFAFGRQTEGDETCRTIMIHIPYTAKHDSVHTLRIVRMVKDTHLEEDVEVTTLKPAPGEVVPAQGNYWEWDGNEEKPTLSPSIACGMPKSSDWHGYMVAGRLEACE